MTRRGATCGNRLQINERRQKLRISNDRPQILNSHRADVWERKRAVQQRIDYGRVQLQKRTRDEPSVKFGIDSINSRELSIVQTGIQNIRII